MQRTRKIHNGVVGLVITLGVVLGSQTNPGWFWLPGIIGALMIQSAFTGFCPVYFLLGKCGLPN
jgi:Inner membrane protein YgaP-like, transmembrane domain